MHILIAVLGALAAAFWAFTYFVNAAREGQDALRDVKGAFRGAKWSRRIEKRLIETMTDPREAAAAARRVHARRAPPAHRPDAEDRRNRRTGLGNPEPAHRRCTAAAAAG